VARVNAVRSSLTCVKDGFVWMSKLNGSMIGHIKTGMAQVLMPDLLRNKLARQRLCLPVPILSLL